MMLCDRCGQQEATGVSSLGWVSTDGEGGERTEHLEFLDRFVHDPRIPTPSDLREFADRHRGSAA